MEKENCKSRKSINTIVQCEMSDEKSDSQHSSFFISRRFIIFIECSNIMKEGMIE